MFKDIKKVGLGISRQSNPNGIYVVCQYDQIQISNTVISKTPNNISNNCKDFEKLFN